LLPPAWQIRFETKVKPSCTAVLPPGRLRAWRALTKSVRGNGLRASSGFYMTMRVIECFSRSSCDLVGPTRALRLGRCADY
jgi:hypothetical protein